ncbi:uncharacterized protein LOC128366889 [Scomber japonicus]|uniref:uncharacterized protein LOC128366889 n=1 Tax=Scomber japonicus TaxID=13676 RepID=UPI002304DC47|nr:uncharacterized protein LOC128366889 [Scomber japonicus]
MVQCQLYTLDHLMNSGFGRPYPRHGLQLLFWFANNCVICCQISNFVVLKLVSDCQPERGSFGFHQFGNNEELLPVLSRSRRGTSRRKMTYFEVGNLNTETYPGSADLPTYVTENYGLDSNYNNYNIDRIIISCQVRTRLVETVYVTEHDAAVFGRFSPDRTYEISCELIRALQNSQLDLTTFLTQMGYYVAMEEIYNPQPSYNTVQTYSGSTTTRGQSSNQQLNLNTELFSYDQQGNCTVNITSYIRGLAVEVQPTHKKRQQALYQSYWHSDWQRAYKDAYRESKKGSGGGGIGLIRLLLGAGALYLAVKCWSWLRSWWETDLKEHVLKNLPWRAPSYQHPHIMLDYVF